MIKFLKKIPSIIFSSSSFRINFHLRRSTIGCTDPFEMIIRISTFDSVEIISMKRRLKNCPEHIELNWRTQWNQSFDQTTTLEENDRDQEKNRRASRFLTWEWDHCSIVKTAEWTCSLLMEIFVADDRSIGASIVIILREILKKDIDHVSMFFCSFLLGFLSVKSFVVSSTFITMKCCKREEKKMKNWLFRVFFVSFSHSHLISWSEQTNKEKKKKNMRIHLSSEFKHDRTRSLCDHRNDRQAEMNVYSLKHRNRNRFEGFDKHFSISVRFLDVRQIKGSKWRKESMLNRENSRINSRESLVPNWLKTQPIDGEAQKCFPTSNEFPCFKPIEHIHRSSVNIDHRSRSIWNGRWEWRADEEEDYIREWQIELLDGWIKNKEISECPSMRRRKWWKQIDRNRISISPKWISSSMIR